MSKKEKKIKTDAQMKKGFITRGIVYGVLLVLFIAGAIVFNTTGLKDDFYYALVPASQEVDVHDNKMTFYSEILSEKDENGDEQRSLTFYYFDKDENGEEQKIYLPKGKIDNGDGSETRISLNFYVFPAVGVAAVNVVLRVGIVAFLLCLIILAIKASRFASGMSEYDRVVYENFKEKLRTRLKSVGKKKKQEAVTDGESESTAPDEKDDK